MPQRNELDEISLEIADEIRAYRKDADAARPIPVGRQSMHADQYRNAWEVMTLEQRRDELKRHGGNRALLKRLTGV